jgi:hypothetical protein
VVHGFEASGRHGTSCATRKAVDWAICPIVLTTSKPRRRFGVVVLRLCVIALLRIAAARDISAGAAKTAA